MKCLRNFVCAMLCFGLLTIFGGSLAFASDANPQISPASIVEIGQSVTPEYLPPNEFFALAAEEGIEPYAVATEPNTPVTSSTGLKGILLDLFGPYSPTITQLQYRQGSNQYYTYVNDISPDYVWLCSAGIFALVLFCIFRMGGTLLCRR